jgi:hypothetical protein
MTIRKATALAAAATALLASAGARATDACHGHDVACDASECLVCWTGADGDLACEETSLAEVLVLLPGCADDAAVFGLVIPEAPRPPVLIGTGGRTVLELPPAPQVDLPTPQRTPSSSPNR